jgi:branched-subunit amino acid ABC-type transport system permease component
VRVIVLGLMAGSIFSLSAVALVLVYRATGVLNFAQGAVGMLGTFTFVGLSRTLALPLALALGLIVAALLGALLALGTAPLRDRLQATVLTLGLLGLLQALAQLIFGGHPVVVAHLFPPSPIRVAGAIFGSDVLVSAVLAMLLCAGTLAVVRRTRYGLLARAVASRPRVVSALGLDERPVIIGSWVVASVLAALAGVLLLTVEPAPSTASLTLTVIQSFAAALVGRLVSIGGAIAGGLISGLLAAAADQLIPVTGSGEAAVFLLMIVLLIAYPPRMARSAVPAPGGIR